MKKFCSSIFQTQKDLVYIWLIVVLYAFLVIISLNNCYFWDNVQQTSKEAFWFYTNNFSSLILPGFSENSDIVGTGYHPPLMGIMTAVLWKILEMKLWVSHAFIAIWAVLLIYNTFRLLKLLVPQDIAPYVFMVLLVDSTILAQLLIASPDIIILTAFVISVRAISENKPLMLSAALLFLVLINGRGTLTGGIVFLFYIIHQVVTEDKRITLRMLVRSSLPFIPAFMVAGVYFGYYIAQKGWFFNHPDSPWGGGWENPEGIRGIIKNIAAYSLRLVENGRIFIWFLGIYALIRLVKTNKVKAVMSGQNLSFLLLFTFLFLLFFYFAITTKIVINSRYYMGMFFIFTILVYKIIINYLSVRKIKIISYIAIVFLLSGNFWIYPDKMAKAWDATLGHWPYYRLRDKCYTYLEDNNNDFSKVSGGFCFSGNQRYVDLKDRDLYISHNPENKYFIYSNISNLNDELIDELCTSGKWKELVTFRNCFVFVSIYKNTLFNDDD